MKPADVTTSPSIGQRPVTLLRATPAQPSFPYTAQPSATTAMDSGRTQGYTYLYTDWGDEKSKSFAMLFFKAVLVSVMLLLIIALCVAFIMYYNQDESKHDDDGSDTDPITEIHVPFLTTDSGPVRTYISTSRNPGTSSTTTTTTIAAATMTTTKSKTMICTVSETLRIEDSITEGICDYAVFSDLAVVRGDLKPVQGKHAWGVFKRAVANSRKTKGGVSFSSHLAPLSEGTLQQLRSVDTAKLEELIATRKMIALGTLGLSRDSVPVVHLLLKAFEYLRAALEDKPGSITFLGAWIITAHDARTFARSLGRAQDIDFVIIQTHITMTTQKGPCHAYMISQVEEDGEVPNFSVAKQAITGLREHALGSPKLLLSSTMAVMGYAGKKDGPALNFDRRECERSFVVDIDAVCRSTLGDQPKSYVKRDMSTYISFNEAGTDYMFVFESKESLQDKAKEFGNLTDGWAFFDAHRDVYGPCRSGRAYERLKLGVSEMRRSTSA